MLILDPLVIFSHMKGIILNVGVVDDITLLLYSVATVAFDHH